MPEKVTISLLISGTFTGESFLQWIAHRANLLSLTGWAKIQSHNLLEVQVSGHQVLVDAFETACTLGPMDVDVDGIEVGVINVELNERSELCAGFRLL